MWNIGLYASYLINLHNSPVIRTKGTRITNKVNNPMENVVIGLEIGLRFNEMNK